MSRRVISGGVGALIAIGTLGYGSTAHANVLYNFDYTVVTDNGGGTDYSGVLEVDGTTVVGITGTASAYGSILSLLPTNTYGINDNQFSPDPPYLTFFGISFSVDGHGYSNLYNDVHLGWSEFNNSADVARAPNSSGTFAVSPVVGTSVPEPSSVTVFAAGLTTLALVGVLSRRNTAARRTSLDRAS